MRIMIVAVIAMVPVLIERIYNEEVDRADRVAAAHQQTLSLARQAAAAQNEGIVSVRAFLQSIASARSAFIVSNDECNNFLTKIAAPFPWVQALSVADLQGKIVCSSLPQAIGLDISNRAHFIKAIDSSDFILSNYFLSSTIGAPVITAALAQKGSNGAAAAVVLAVLDLRWFGQFTSGFAVPGGTMLMIDGAGSVLAEHPKNRNLIGHQFKDHPLVKEVLAKHEGVTTIDGLDGVRRIFGFVRLPNTDTYFMAGLNADEVLGAANREMFIAFAELGVIITLALLAIWFGGERLLVQPIRVLAETATQIGHGDRSVAAANLPWASEFVPLAVALDDMTATLDAREQELRDRNEQLAELAHTDALTGLANRRTFNDRLAREWQNAVQSQHSIAVLMIDVDHFKAFNDCYGHLQGDACLRKVGGVLMSGTRNLTAALAGVPDLELPPSFHSLAGHARRSDFAARYGGEEFAVLLPNTDLDGAIKVGERLRQGVEDLLMAHDGAPWGFVSISVGAAAVVPNADAQP
ncbi:MAG: diguanylate cyclase, partial [Pseudolabrys sp.]|nr:diguanylate cyclase [Pseudolabrys sp.]